MSNIVGGRRRRSGRRRSGRRRRSCRGGGAVGDNADLVEERAGHVVGDDPVGGDLGHAGGRRRKSHKHRHSKRSRKGMRRKTARRAYMTKRGKKLF